MYGTQSCIVPFRMPEIMLNIASNVHETKTCVCERETSLDSEPVTLYLPNNLSITHLVQIYMGPMEVNGSTFGNPCISMAASCPNPSVLSELQSPAPIPMTIANPSEALPPPAHLISALRVALTDQPARGLTS